MKRPALQKKSWIANEGTIDCANANTTNCNTNNQTSTNNGTTMTNFTLKKNMIKIGTCLSSSTRCSEGKENVTTSNATTLTNQAFTSTTQQSSAVGSASCSPSKLVLLKDIVNSPLVLSLNKTNFNRSAVNQKEKQDEPPQKPSDIMRKRLRKIVQKLPICDRAQIETEMEAFEQQNVSKTLISAGNNIAAPQTTRHSIAVLKARNQQMGAGLRQIRTSNCSPSLVASPPNVNTNTLNNTNRQSNGASVNNPNVTNPRQN